jgi:hypothetical protein
MSSTRAELGSALGAALWLAGAGSGCASLAAPDEWASSEVAGSGASAAGANGSGGGGGAVTSSAAVGSISAGGFGGSSGDGGSAGGSSADCQPPGPGWTMYFSPSSKHCYGTLSDLYSWSSARDICTVAFLGDLAAIGDVDEQLELAAHLASRYDMYAEFWIGLYVDGGGFWTWSTGEMVGYQAWASGQPSGGAEEDCAMVDGRKGWDWNDIDCGDTKPLLCERLPP